MTVTVTYTARTDVGTDFMVSGWNKLRWNLWDQRFKNSFNEIWTTHRTHLKTYETGKCVCVCVGGGGTSLHTPPQDRIIYWNCFMEGFMFLVIYPAVCRTWESWRGRLSEMFITCWVFTVIMKNNITQNPLLFSQQETHLPKSGWVMFYEIISLSSHSDEDCQDDVVTGSLNTEMGSCLWCIYRFLLPLTDSSLHVGAWHQPLLVVSTVFGSILQLTFLRRIFCRLS